MKIKSVALSAAVSLALMSSVAANASTYAFNFDSTAYDVAGQFVTSDTLNAVGGYDILSVTGNVTGVGGGTISSLIANPTQPLPYNNSSYIYDNVKYDIAPYLSTWGMLFTTVNGNVWNLWGNNPADFQLHSFMAGVDVHGSSTVSAVPLPAAAWLFGSAVLGLGALRRKQAGCQEA